MTDIGLAAAERSVSSAFDREALAQLIMEASSSFETDRPKARRCIDQAVELVRGDGLTPLGTSATRGGLSGWQMRLVKVYIDANLGEKILIADLAGRARVSVGHFFRTFRTSFGVSPQAYIMRQRILRAERLMRTSDAPLARIALECGLCDQAHLSRSFRRIVGVSPNVWRREIGLSLQLTAVSKPT